MYIIIDMAGLPYQNVHTLVGVWSEAKLLYGPFVMSV